MCSAGLKEDGMWRPGTSPWQICWEQLYWCDSRIYICHRCWRKWYHLTLFSDIKIHSIVLAPPANITKRKLEIQRIGCRKNCCKDLQVISEEEGICSENADNMMFVPSSMGLWILHISWTVLKNFVHYLQELQFIHIATHFFRTRDWHFATCST